MGALYYVPIIHGMDVRSIMLFALHKGKDALAKQYNEVNDFEAMLQARIPQFLANSNLDLSKLHIKVDGLVKSPGMNCDEALDLCRKMARSGSVVHKIITDLCSQGAKVWGTENPDIISLWQGLAKDCELDDQTAKELLIDRDQYIASNIRYIGRNDNDSSVLCFMGASHNVPLRLRQRECVFDLIHPVSRKDIEDTIPSYLGRGFYFDSLL
ncbi:MAG: hypothetical protein Q7S43_02935 [bacterium]|nr:hypothetical protein [bacterium]MDO8496384.1 hypothetical protein [bacterium]